MTRRPCHHSADCPGTGLDCGPDQERHYVKRAVPKTAAELTEIRARAWITRRAKYGECGHHGSYLR